MAEGLPMFRRSKWLAVVLLLGGVSACLGVLLLLARREPEFYTRSPCPADWDTRERSARLLTRVQELKNEVRSKPEWGDTFAADDLNCFFVENMGRCDGLCAMLPKGMHSPRVAIDGDRLRFGLAYGEGFWSSVVWVELRIWLVANEQNLVAVEVCDLRAGSLPIGAQSVLDAVAEAAREWNIDVTWYRLGGNPVGLFKFYPDQPQPTSQILTLQVKDGQIVVAGRSSQDGSPSALVGVTPLLGGARE